VKVLVAGANGFLGRAAVRALAAGGHEVVGLVRSAQKGEVVRAAGGAPAVGDVQSIPSLVDAARGCDALIHAAAAATTASREVGQSEAAKVRVDGAYQLVAAARKVGAKRLLVVSGTWLHGDRREPITEATPPKPTGTAMFNWQAERAAMDANKPGVLEVVVIRPGMVYGDGSWFKEMVDEIRAGTYRVPGDGANHWSPLHVDDCGEAMRMVLEKGKAGEVYLAADDEPVPLRAFVDATAAALGAARPAAISMEEAVRIHGEATARHLAANQSVNTAKIKGLGWAPRVRTAPEGIPPVVREMAAASGGRMK
jgi:nucleoside-diphosphate-sugar epimerase